MIRPGNFGFDTDTMADNAFQNVSSGDKSEKEIHQSALDEFDCVVQLFKRNGISVIIFNDQPSPAKPDAIFPNNWFSTHSEGIVIIYPMMAESRRLEQRMDIVKYFEDVYKVN